MKALLLVPTLLCSHSICVATGSCFESKEIKELIESARSIDDCFKGTVNKCGLNSWSLESQIDQNAARLVPFDRTSDDGFMDKTVGRVEVTFGTYDGSRSGRTFAGTGQKISSCHVLTSAHLLYGDPKFNVASTSFQIKFRTVQACDLERRFAKVDTAEVYFKMTSKSDYVCGLTDGNVCVNRKFYGHSDMVVLKLHKGSYIKDGVAFSLDTRDPNMHDFGRRVNCWGFPGHGSYLHDLTEAQTRGLLFSQKGAQIFGDKAGEVDLGIITNAIAYKGMSGGACSTDESPRTLVGLFANDNKLGGQASFDVVNHMNRANYLGGFQRLANRYASETGKDISKLEKDCQ